MLARSLPAHSVPATKPPVSRVVYHLQADLAATPTAGVFALLAAMRAWAGWRLPALRAVHDPRARVVVRTPAGQWCFIEPLWRDDVLLLWEAVWRVPVSRGSWCTRVRVEPFGNAARLDVRSEAVRIPTDRVPPLIAGGDGVAASPEAFLQALAAASTCFVDHCPVRPEARSLAAPDVAAFVRDELSDPVRRLPVVVLSALEEPASDGSPIYVMPPQALASALLGRAHVVALASAAASYALSDAVGKERSAYLGAARVYRPGFGGADATIPHPNLSIIRLRADGPAAVLSVVAPPNWPVDPPGLDLLALRDERTSQLATSVALDTASGLGDAPPTRQETDLRARLAALRAERAGLLAELEQARAEATATDPGVNEGAEDGAAGDADDETPLSVLADIQARYHDVLVVHPLALRSAEASSFEDTVSLRAALGALGDFARANGGLGRGLRDAFMARGIDYAPHLSPQCLSGRYRRQFVRSWDGQAHTCEDHVRLGSSYDPRFCLRVYFDWTHRTADGRVLIGHCGRHPDVPTTT